MFNPNPTWIAYSVVYCFSSSPNDRFIFPLLFSSTFNDRHHLGGSGSAMTFRVLHL
ncbi:hypothetical protein HanHA300_Chr09g0309641 [Helianthus annuus]|nr:hypothetical protein HanHA300_Chr09g0309641 [Helianthus annuus]KAJ0541592.1 hypothetical protein HanHA89_Chr09g0330251 [Helianthus annuus]KAJ0706666.1 hypothetical protein HanLR1_Chr09g0309681 [Helianthus annuus]KAJ0710688.1 hypothetical protein HanOQP8_Chr09g0315261 [Helianthus annuus]